MAIEEKIKNRRVFLLLFSHAIILQDCYILGLPMGFVVWTYPNYAISYAVLILLMLLSLFPKFTNGVRNTLFGLGMLGLYLHWYLETDYHAYHTKPFSLTGILLSVFFQICFYYYLYRMVKKMLMAVWIGKGENEEPDALSD